MAYALLVTAHMQLSAAQCRQIVAKLFRVMRKTASAHCGRRIAVRCRIGCVPLATAASMALRI
jgi:hypothetical protein